MFSFKDAFQLLAGMMFEGNGYSPDALTNLIQFTICMWTAGPFIG